MRLLDVTVATRVVHKQGLYKMTPWAIEAQSEICCTITSFLITVIVSAVSTC